MDIFKSIKHFFSLLSTIDIIFLIAILILLILIVILVYFIKSNKEMLTERDFFNDDNIVEETKKTDNILNEFQEIKTDNEVYDDEENELLDLEMLTKRLKDEQNESRIKFTEYEKDQEEKAIISYDELVEKHNRYAINYEKEEIFDDLVVKKVDLHDLENKEIVEDIKEEVRVISYKKEEDFLKALKELNILLQ